MPQGKSDENPTRHQIWLRQREGALATRQAGTSPPAAPSPVSRRRKASVDVRALVRELGVIENLARSGGHVTERISHVRERLLKLIED